MLRFKLVLSFVFVLIISIAFSQNKRENTLLWKIEKSGYNTSYLFGTIHIKDKRVFYFNDSLLSKINEVDALITELDFSKESLQEIAESMKLPKGKTLKDVLKQDQYEKLKAFAERHVMYNFSALEHFKPFMILMLVMQSGVPNQMPDAVDIYLYKYAESLNKQTSGLETIKEQIDALDVMTNDEIIKSIDEYEAQEGISYEDLTVAYEASDLSEIDRLMQQEEAKNEKFMKALLQKRNKVMVKRIPVFMEENATLFAVGAGHLSGEKGLLNMLEQKGFLVSPILASKTLAPNLAVQEAPDSLKGQKFDVNFPSKVNYSAQEVNGIQMHIYSNPYESTESNNILFNLIYYKTSIDVNTMEEADKKEFFDTFEKGMLSSLNGKVEKKEELQLASGIGADIEMSLAQNNHMGIRIILKDDFCIILQVMSNGPLTTSEVEAFYNSLEIK